MTSKHKNKQKFAVFRPTLIHNFLWIFQVLENVVEIGFCDTRESIKEIHIQSAAGLDGSHTEAGHESRLGTDRGRGESISREDGGCSHERSQGKSNHVLLFQRKVVYRGQVKEVDKVECFG